MQNTYARLVAALFLTVAATSATSASFDCSKARSTSEILICENPYLSLTDDLLAKLFAAAKRASATPSALQHDADEAWRKREMVCANAYCVSNWLNQRVAVYERMLGLSHESAVATYLGTKDRLIACADEESQKPGYTSADGGHSALMIIGACKSLWKKYVNECMAEGNSEYSCNLASVTIAQMALKFRGR